MFVSSTFGKPVYEKQGEIDLRERKRVADEHYMRGIRHFRRGRIDEAIDEWGRVIEINPRHRRVRELIKEAQKMKRKRQQ